MQPRAVLVAEEGGTLNIRITCANDDPFWVNIHIDRGDIPAAESLRDEQLTCEEENGV